MTATTRPRPERPSGSDRPSRQADPRVLARRAQVARQEDLRRLWTVGTLAVLATLAVVAIGVANSPLLDVEAVTVTGAERAEVDEVVAATGVEVNQPLVEVDPAEVRQAVEAVPWVDTAVVDRTWGWRGGVTVAVTERTPLVVFPASGGGQVLVDGTGRQLAEVASAPDGVLPVTGLALEAEPGAEVPPAAQMAVNLTQSLGPGLSGWVESVSVADGGLDLQLVDGAVAAFGDDRLLADKLVALETMLAWVDLTCLDVIRVEVPSSPTASRLDGDEVRPAGGEEPGDDGGGC